MIKRWLVIRDQTKKYKMERKEDYLLTYSSRAEKHTRAEHLACERSTLSYIDTASSIPVAVSSVLRCIATDLYSYATNRYSGPLHVPTLFYIKKKGWPSIADHVLCFTIFVNSTPCMLLTNKVVVSKKKNRCKMTILK